MKSYVLGMFLLAAPLVNGEELQLRSDDVVEVMIQDSDVNLTVERSRTCSRHSSYHERDILASIRCPLNSSSGYLLLETGEISPREYVLTVLNAYPDQGVYRIRIASPLFSHDFLVGRVGEEYFGQGVEDRIYGILLKKVKDRLEVSYSLNSESTQTNWQIRAVFPLH